MALVGAAAAIVLFRWYEFATRTQPTVVVEAAYPGADDREQVARAVRTRLGDVPGLGVRSRDLSGPGPFPRCAYPVELTVQGPDEDRVKEFATKLVERLRQGGQLTDVWAGTESPAAVERFNGCPMSLITANPAAGVSLAQARRHCEAVADEVLSADCRLAWLGDAP